MDFVEHLNIQKLPHLLKTLSSYNTHNPFGHEGAWSRQSHFIHCVEKFWMDLEKLLYNVCFERM